MREFTGIWWCSGTPPREARAIAARRGAAIWHRLRVVEGRTARLDMSLATQLGSAAASPVSIDARPRADVTECNQP